MSEPLHPDRFDPIERQEAREMASALADDFLSRHEGGRHRFFEEIYRRAAGDPSVIPWASLSPDPLLVDWLTAHLFPPVDYRAAVVGCGLGDDAEELADWGFRVTGFDVSETAIEWCRERFVGSAVTYKVADLLDLPEIFSGAFDFVLEDSTLQSMRPANLPSAILGLAELLAPGGLLLVICRGREAGQMPEGTPPWPLALGDLDILETESSLTCTQFEDFFDKEDPPIRRFRATYRRS